MLLCFFWGGWDVVNAGMTCHDSGSIQMALSRIEEVHVPELFFFHQSGAKSRTNPLWLSQINKFRWHFSGFGIVLEKLSRDEDL